MPNREQVTFEKVEIAGRRSNWNLWKIITSTLDGNFIPAGFTFYLRISMKNEKELEEKKMTLSLPHPYFVHQKTSTCIIKLKLCREKQ